MSSKDDQKYKKKGKLDKHTGASLVLAFTVCCFLYTMFLAVDNLGVSYAVDNNAPPSRLTFNGTLLSNAGGVGSNNIWFYMGNDRDLPLTFDFKATDGTNTYDMYCIEGQVGISGTDSYVNPKEMSKSYGPGLAFILNNSYPANPSSSYTAFCGTDSNCKKYVTQYAIWYYLDKMGVKDSNGNTQLTPASTAKIDYLYNGGDNGARAVVSLTNDAIKYNSQEQVAPTISVNTDNITYKIVDNGKFLESSEITVNSNNSSKFKSYTVSIAGDNNSGAFIVDSSGNSVSTFDSNVKFRVRIPMDKLVTLNDLNLNLSIVASIQKDAVYEYTPSSGPNEQRPIIATITTTTTNVSASLKITLVEITKSDITNGKPVAGAELAITDSTGAEVARWVTDGNKHYVTLKPGNYTLTEITSPDGYELNKESVPFTVNEGGTITKVEMKNTPLTHTPETAASIPVYLYIIGAMILVIGVGVIYATTRPKKNK